MSHVDTTQLDSESSDARELNITMASVRFLMDSEDGQFHKKILNYSRFEPTDELLVRA